MMNALEHDAAKAAMTKMFQSGHFSICVIDQILKMSGGVPPRREYELLRTLHCVDFKDMPTRLRLELPRVIQIVVESQPIQSPFDLSAVSPVAQLLETYR